MEIDGEQKTEQAGCIQAERAGTVQQVRAKYGTLAGLAGLGCNVLLFGAKLAVGTLSGSIAITADAFNNLSDAGSCIVTAVGFQMSGKPADKEHPFGHGRIEYVSGLAVAFLILLVAVELFADAVDKMLHPAAVEGNVVTVAVLLASIAVKLFMGLFYRRVGKKIGSPSLMAAMTDSISDVVATSGVLLSLLAAMQFHWNIDAVMGAIVSVVIFIAGIKTLRETLNPLLGQAPSPELVEQIRNRVLSYDGILGIHDLLTRSLSVSIGSIWITVWTCSSRSSSRSIKSIRSWLFIISS